MKNKKADIWAYWNLPGTVPGELWNPDLVALIPRNKDWNDDLQQMLLP